LAGRWIGVRKPPGPPAPLSIAGRAAGGSAALAVGLSALLAHAAAGPGQLFGETNMTHDSIVIDMFYPQSVGQVWAALTSADALAAWLMPNDFEPRVGHRFTFRTTPDQFWDGTVY